MAALPNIPITCTHLKGNQPFKNTTHALKDYKNFPTKVTSFDFKVIHLLCRSDLTSYRLVSHVMTPLSALLFVWNVPAPFAGEAVIML